MRVLVIEDEPDLRRLLEQALREDGYAVDVAEDGTTGLYKATTWDYDALVLDLMLPGRNGFDVLQFLRAEQPDALRRTVVVTAASEATLQHFDAKSVHALIRKPFDIEELTLAVDDCRALRTESLGPTGGENAPSSAPPSPH